MHAVHLFGSAGECFKAIPEISQDMTLFLVTVKGLEFGGGAWPRGPPSGSATVQEKVYTRH